MAVQYCIPEYTEVPHAFTYLIIRVPVRYVLSSFYFYKTVQHQLTILTKSVWKGVYNYSSPNTSFKTQPSSEIIPAGWYVWKISAKWISLFLSKSNAWNRAYENHIPLASSECRLRNVYRYNYVENEQSFKLILYNQVGSQLP